MGRAVRGVVLVAGILVGLGGLLGATAEGAEPLGVGDTFPTMTFETQHERTITVGPGTRLVLVTHDMDAGGLAKAALADETAESLAARGAVYVADISKMPGLVSRLIAIPRMRRRPYPVLLDRDAETARILPVVEGRVTAVWLDAGRVTRLAQLASESDVGAALAAPAGEAPEASRPDAAPAARDPAP